MLRKVFLSLTLSSTILFTTNSFAATCANQNEMDAVYTRALQSHLMVAALSCGKSSHYNNFVKKYNSELTKQGKLLKGYFHRIHNGTANRKLDAFVTGLANASSQLSADQGLDRFCRESGKLFNKVMNSSARDLKMIAYRENFKSVKKIQSCSN